MKVVPGLMNAKNPKPPSPKASPKDFQWPPQDHDDKIAQKLAASLQELLPARDWKHTDLARALYGTFGPNDTPRNPSPCRRWVTAEHPIPNEETAAYIAQVLDVPMSRLLEPQGKFDPHTPMIRPRSDSVRFPSGNKVKGKVHAKKKTKQKVKAAKAEAPAKRKYTRRAAVNGHTNGSGEGWVLPDGIALPDYTINAIEEHAGYVSLKLDATLPLERAMAILHMLKPEAATE